MSVTVLLAAYHGERYIGEQLDSILGQTVPGIRILASDDGSTDGTRRILDEYQRQYPERVFLRHRNGGRQTVERDGETASGNGPQTAGLPPAAANFFWLIGQALDQSVMSTSDYFLLSDQDDVWYPKKVETLLNAMGKVEHGNLPVLLHSDMEVVDKDRKVLAESLFAYQHIRPDRKTLSEILVENPVTGGAVMMNRAMAELAKEPPGSCFMHDWWLAVLASCFGVIEFVAEPLYQYRQHETNTLGAGETGTLKRLEKRTRQSEEVRERYGRMFVQAQEFLALYGDRLSEEKKRTLKAYLALPGQSPWERLSSIRRNHFYKSSRLQTLAQCVTIPRER